MAKDKASKTSVGYDIPKLSAPVIGVGFIGLIIVTVLLRDVLGPFVAGMVAAFMFDPMVTKLSTRMPRWLASILAVILAVMGMVLAVLAIIPRLVREVVSFIEKLPHYIEQFKVQMGEHLTPLIEVLETKLHGQMGEMDWLQVGQAASGHASSVLRGVGKVAEQILSSGMAVFDIISFLVITPIVAFYCLRDWPQIRAGFLDLIPHRGRDLARTLMKEFDETLAGFLRGQALVCLILGTGYAIGLSILGVNFALVIGAVSGVLSFVPYVGSIIGFSLAVGVSLAQSPDITLAVWAAGIFLIGQAVEGNFLTPKLVGESVGLHPVWVIFALMAGGSLAGFTGMLLAVPIAALIGVMVRHGVSWYKASDFFKNLNQKAAS